MLDAFYAMQRLSKLLLESHGARCARFARSRTEFRITDAQDGAAVKAALFWAGIRQDRVLLKRS
ncbi:unnamed protein product [Scytosiphon promiscuus]